MTPERFKQLREEFSKTGPVAECLEEIERLVNAIKSCLWVDECRCDIAYTGRGRHEPNTLCGELDPLRDAISQITPHRGPVDRP